jgi:hypothetical protein
MSYVSCLRILKVQFSTQRICILPQRRKMLEHALHDVHAARPNPVLESTE